MEVGKRVVVMNILGKKEQYTSNSIVRGISAYLHKQGTIVAIRENEPPFDCLVEFENGDRIAFKFSELEPVN